LVAGRGGEERSGATTRFRRATLTTAFDSLSSKSEYDASIATIFCDVYQAHPKKIALMRAITAKSFDGILNFDISCMTAPLGTIPFEPK
jgi:hypothetical protein